MEPRDVPSPARSISSPTTAPHTTSSARPGPGTASAGTTRMSSRCGTTARSSQNLGAAAPPHVGQLSGAAWGCGSQRSAQRKAQRTRGTKYTRIRAPCMRSRACGLCGLIAFRAKKARGPVGVLVPTPPGRFARVRTRRLPNMGGQAPVLLRPVPYGYFQIQISRNPEI